MYVEKNIYINKQISDLKILQINNVLIKKKIFKSQILYPIWNEK